MATPSLGIPSLPGVCLLVFRCVGLVGLEEEGGFGYKAWW